MITWNYNRLHLFCFTLGLIYRIDYLIRRIFRRSSASLSLSLCLWPYHFCLSWRFWNIGTFWLIFWGEYMAVSVHSFILCQQSFPFCPVWMSRVHYHCTRVQIELKKSSIIIYLRKRFWLGLGVWRPEESCEESKKIHWPLKQELEHWRRHSSVYIFCDKTWSELISSSTRLKGYGTSDDALKPIRPSQKRMEPINSVSNED